MGEKIRNLMFHVWGPATCTVASACLRVSEERKTNSTDALIRTTPWKRGELMVTGFVVVTTLTFPLELFIPAFRSCSIKLFKTVSCVSKTDSVLWQKFCPKLISYIRKRLIAVDVARYFDTNCDASFKFTSPPPLIHVENHGKNQGLVLYSYTVHTVEPAYFEIGQ